MVKHKIILLTFLLFLHQSFGKKYYNYTLYRGIPVKDDHLVFFQNLTSKYDVNFWREPGQLNKPVDFMISPEDQDVFIKEALRNGLYLTTIMEDVQKALDLQTVKSYVRRSTDSFDWLNYFRIDDIYTWLKDLANVYRKTMTVKSIGKTFENRDIMSVTINLGDEKKRLNSKPYDKEKVIIEGGIHAREWISSAFVTYFINAIVHAPYTHDEELKRIAYAYEWHIVPVLNPDGYEYTHTTDRMWRKNRHGSGVDINRNFKYGFGTEGISFDQNSEIYCGPKAFSELESTAMANFIKDNKLRLQHYFAFHAYGQYMIIPYADSKKHRENFDDMKLLGLAATKKLKHRYGTRYTVGTAFDTVGYMTSGISGDWVKSTLRIPYVATFELRDSGRYGFALPPNQILPACKETMDAMIYLLTPRETGWKEQMQSDVLSDSQEKTLLDKIVVVCNVLLFIIVRFDYLWVLLESWLTYCTFYLFFFPSLKILMCTISHRCSMVVMLGSG